MERQAFFTTSIATESFPVSVPLNAALRGIVFGGPCGGCNTVIQIPGATQVPRLPNTKALSMNVRRLIIALPSSCPHFLRNA